MSNEDFDAYSSPLPIPGTSYLVQIGKQISTDKWEARIVKGREIIANRVLESAELNGNVIIGFIMQEVAIPMINPYQISKTVKILMKQGERGSLATRPTMLEPPLPIGKSNATSRVTSPTTDTIIPTSTSSESPNVEVKAASEYNVLMSPRTSSLAASDSSGNSGEICPRCKNSIADNFYFCPICSKQLQEKRCPGCNKEIRPDYQLCPYCGIKL